MDATERWLRRIAEPLLEDERLRGDLDDASYQPLLDWALDAAESCAEAAAGAADPSQLAESCSDQLRAVLFAATRTAVDGRREELLGLIGPPVFDGSTATTVRDRLAAAELADEPGANARLLAQALTAGRRREGSA